MNINKVFLSGNLTRDPELRSTAGGLQVLRLGIAVNGSKKNPDGSFEDVPNFFDVSIVGRMAESVAPHLSKGQKVFIEGRLRWRQLEKDGEKRSSVDITADRIEFASHGKGKMSAPQQPMQQQLHGAGGQQYVYDESIPF